MVNGLHLYSHQCNQWRLKALYNIAQHSPIHADIHTPTAVSTMQRDSQFVGSSQGEAACSETLQNSARSYVLAGTYYVDILFPILGHTTLLF